MQWIICFQLHLFFAELPEARHTQHGSAAVGFEILQIPMIFLKVVCKLCKIFGKMAWHLLCTSARPFQSPCWEARFVWVLWGFTNPPWFGKERLSGWSGAGAPPAHSGRLPAGWGVLSAIHSHKKDLLVNLGFLSRLQWLLAWHLSYFSGTCSGFSACMRCFSQAWSLYHLRAVLCSPPPSHRMDVSFPTHPFSFP